jgi:iron complex transport system substrate-binding protein
MKFFRQILLIVMLAGLWSDHSIAISAADLPPATTASTFPLTLTDGAGRLVKISAAPHRIISLSPAATDILVKVGANTELVGVTRYCDNPALVESRLKRLGGVLDPDYEGIVALKPDLVVMPLLADKSMQDKLTTLGLNFVVLHPEGLAGVLADIRMIGLASGHNNQGAQTLKNFEVIQLLAKAATQAIPPEKRPRVLIRMGDVSPAPGSYVDDLLTAAGGRNVLPKGARAWVTVSLESILQLNPDLIVDIRLPEASANPVARDPKLPAEFRVITLNDGKPFYRPGPDLGDALIQLTQALYPDRFTLTPNPIPAAKPPSN